MRNATTNIHRYSKLMSVFALMLAVFCPSFCAIAGESSEYRWYLGAEAGMSSGNPDSESLRLRLVNQGFDVTTEVDDSSSGARLYVGHYLGKERETDLYSLRPALTWAVELGYSYLGNFDVSLAGVVANESALIASVVEEKPRSGHSVDVSLAAHLQLEEEFTLKPHVGFFYNRQQFRLGVNGSIREETSDAIGVLAGLGGWWQFSSWWKLGLDWSLYIENGAAVSQLRLGVQWH